jgi:hypothetical protein
MAENVVNIQLAHYPRQSDETLYEIIAYFGQNYEYTSEGFPSMKYKFAYELLQLRHNRNLVEQTTRLVNKTMKLAKWTMIVGIGTAILAVFALITYFAGK